MRFVLKILSVLVVSGGTAFNVVACKRTPNNGGSSNKSPDNNSIIYDVSFKKINRVQSVIIYDDYVQFIINKNDVTSIMGVPDSFWKLVSGNYLGYLQFKKSTPNLYDNLAFVYNFSWNDNENIIVNKIKFVSIINVSISMVQISDYDFNVLSFLRK